MRVLFRDLILLFGPKTMILSIQKLVTICSICGLCFACLAGCSTRATLNDGNRPDIGPCVAQNLPSSKDGVITDGNVEEFLNRGASRMVTMEGQWESSNTNVIRCQQTPKLVYVDWTDGTPEPEPDQWIRFTGTIAWRSWDRPHSKYPASVPPDGYYLDWKTAHWEKIKPPTTKKHPTAEQVVPPNGP
jgi:hypothetical protein